ncbi:hypothetical protein K8R32_03080 [bacterium]|nr:hypothetical protein [bacterium]
MLTIIVDATPIYEFFNLPSDVMFERFLMLFGWIPLAFVFLWGAKETWVYYRQIVWGKTERNIFLAIDVPRGNEVSLMSVENLFTYFGGAHGTFSLIEEYWIGMYQLSFSFEIVSIDGYTQFIIRTPEHFRNLTESAVYSVYPDAEITEVNDYTEEVPTIYPDDEYDIWGAEFVYSENHMLPIKTYPDFEHSMGRPEEQFKDPLASLMDLYSSLKPGEQCWYQILVRPTGFGWMAEGDKLISKVIGETVVTKKNLVDKGLDGFIGILSYLSEMIFSIWGDINDKKEEKQEDMFKMFNLKPKEKRQIEAIQHKTSKLGFECKIRFVYAAKKEIINKPKAVNGFVGYMKQFMDLDLNNIKPDMAMTATTTNYFFKEKRLNARKRRIVNAYKARSLTLGRAWKVMNVEELATLWHFPVEAVVKAPLIQKAPGRRSEPPMGLPVGEETVGESFFASGKEKEEDIFSEFKDEKNKEEKKEPVIDLKQKVNNGSEDIFAPNPKGKNLAPDNLPFANN